MLGTGFASFAGGQNLGPGSDRAGGLQGLALGWCGVYGVPARVLLSHRITAGGSFARRGGSRVPPVGLRRLSHWRGNGGAFPRGSCVWAQARDGGCSGGVIGC